MGSAVKDDEQKRTQSKEGSLFILYEIIMMINPWLSYIAGDIVLQISDYQWDDLRLRISFKIFSFFTFSGRNQADLPVFNTAWVGRVVGYLLTR